MNVVSDPPPGLPVLPTLTEQYFNIVTAVAFSYAFWRRSESGKGVLVPNGPNCRLNMPQ